MVLLKKLINKVYFIPYLALILFANYGFCQSDLKIPFSTNEKLIYNLYYNGIKAGSATMKINEKKINGEKYIELNSEIKTNSFVDLVYKIRDKVNILMNYSDFSAKKIIKDIKEKNYKKKSSTIINYEEMIAYINNKKIPLTEKIYDPLSVIYSMRLKNLNINEKFEYDIISNEKLKKINVKVVKTEQTSVPYGKFKTNIISPIGKDEKELLKNKGDMKIWITKDKKRIPIKILIKLKHGNITLKLKDIK